MGTLLIAVVLMSIAILLIRAGIKRKNTAESKLGIFEHPSTFQKPGIGMVSKTGPESGNETMNQGFDPADQGESLR